jgi:hypothetical protein
MQEQSQGHPKRHHRDGNERGFKFTSDVGEIKVATLAGTSVRVNPNQKWTSNPMVILFDYSKTQYYISSSLGIDKSQVSLCFVLSYGASMLLYAPTEIIGIVVDLCPMGAQARLSQTCRRFHEISNPILY